MPETVLQAEGLTKIYKSAERDLVVLDHVSFEVQQGTSLAIIGPSGSGKTTLLGLCAGLDVFVLELGANDGLRGLPLDQTQKNLQSIIDKVKAKYPACQIVLAGMMVPPNMGKQYTDSFRNIYPDLAKKNNATLIHFLLDGVAGNEKLNQADGIHPTAEGHKIIANNLKPIFEKLI